MVKFEGRAQKVICIRDKQIKLGFKIYVKYVIANGFCLNIIPHIGIENIEVKGIIIKLFNNLNKDDFFNLDRYFCGIDLFIYLYKKGIRATGTFLINRNNIHKNIINNLNLKLHESAIYKCNDIIKLLFWKDKKIIFTNIF